MIFGGWEVSMCGRNEKKQELNPHLPPWEGSRESQKKKNKQGAYNHVIYRSGRKLLSQLKHLKVLPPQKKSASL